MTLVELIKQGNYTSIEQAYETITAKNIPVADPKKWTWGGINDAIGPVAADQILNFMETHSMRSLALQLVGEGISLSDLRVQEVLMQMSALIR